MSQYDAVAKKTLATFKRKGGLVTLISTTPRRFDENTGQWTGGDPITDTTYAIQIPDNPMRFEVRNLVVKNPLTLMMAAAGLSTITPGPGVAMQWAGRVANIVDVEALNVDGVTPIYYTVVGGG